LHTHDDGFQSKWMSFPTAMWSDFDGGDHHHQRIVSLRFP